jgi:hypothetical protein
MLLGARSELSDGVCSDGGKGEILGSAKVSDILTQPREAAQLLETVR